MLNKVVSYWSLSIGSCSGNAVVCIDSEGSMVKNDGWDLKINRVTQEIRIKSLVEMPIICKNEAMVKIEIFKQQTWKRHYSQNLQQNCVQQMQNNSEKGIDAFNTSHELQSKVYLIVCWRRGQKRNPGRVQGNTTHSIPPGTKLARFQSIFRAWIKHS